MALRGRFQRERSARARSEARPTCGPCDAMARHAAGTAAPHITLRTVKTRKMSVVFDSAPDCGAVGARDVGARTAAGDVVAGAVVSGVAAALARAGERGARPVAPKRS